MPKKLKIAIIGTRGVPARYGGFETFAEQIALEFNNSGHETTVFGRRKFFQKSSTSEYKGISVIQTPTIYTKYTETPVNSITAYLWAIFHSFDVVIICNAANSPFAFILKLSKAKILINVDGIERKRSKWNGLGRLWYRLGEFCSVLFADRLVTDANVIAEYYQEKFKTDSAIIRYGAHVNDLKTITTLEKFKLKAKEYMLYVSRFEPENNALLVIEAYLKTNQTLPLVMVGDAPYADEYKKSLYDLAKGHNVIFTGYQFEDAYFELRKNCSIYIQATEVGGTHPALVEAMAYGNCILANDVPEHREVVENTGILYDFNDSDSLAEQLNSILEKPSKIEELGRLAAEKASRDYSWSQIAQDYLSEIDNLLK